MDPENPTFPTPPPQPTTPSISPVFPKKNNLVAISLSILLLVTLSATVYLFLRVQNLTKQLAQVQVQATPIPSPVEIPAQEGTTNWKIYINTAYRYSLKYPQNWRTEALAAGSQGKEVLENSTGLNIVEADSTKDYPDITIQAFDLEPTYLEEGTKTAMVVNGIEMIKRETKQETNLYTQVYTIKILNGKFLEILFRYDPTAQTLGILDQILSTLKFTE